MADGGDEDKAGALWRFALAVYQKPGVSDACLLLQDRHGCNVPLLLFAAWAGAERGVVLTADEVAAAQERGRGVAWRGGGAFAGSAAPAEAWPAPCPGSC